MSAVKALIFGIDDLFPKLKPYYDREVERGNLEIVGYAVLENDKIFLVKNLQGEPLQNFSFQKLIISSQNAFMYMFKKAKSLFNVSEREGAINLSNVIDGRIFRIPNFNFPRFCTENIAYGKIPQPCLSTERENNYVIHARNYDCVGTIVELGIKSYIAGCLFENTGSVHVGNFSAISWNIYIAFGLNGDHNYENVSLYALTHLDWTAPKSFDRSHGSRAHLNIGSDVWIGKDSRILLNNPDKPLNIGNGAIIAAESVVVKDVPPFAIVGGNPAKFIKWRFEPEIIEALERIAWWNWDLEKIYDNFHLFKDPKEFVNKFDPQR